jgi:hypothetical protein
MQDSTECRILDDDELEKQKGGFREWREETSTLKAERIFGSTYSRSFPTAFQNYKGSPSSVKEVAAADASFPPFKKKEKRTVMPESEENSLVQSVREMLNVSHIPVFHYDISGRRLSYTPITPIGSPYPPNMYDLSGDSLSSLQNEKVSA